MPMRRPALLALMIALFSTQTICIKNGKAAQNDFGEEGIQEAKLNPTEVNLYVSRYHKNLLLALDKRFYPAAEVSKAFQALETSGNEFCRMLFFKRPKSKKVILTHLAGPMAMTFGNSHRRYLPSLISGCHNFYRMNDQRPDRNFQMVKHLFPDAKKECYSVGYMQPYLMHKELNCTTLNLIDIDWRILQAHHRLLQIIFKKGFTTPAEFNKVASKIELQYQAYGDGSVCYGSAKNFCRHSQSKLCVQSLLSFQKNVQSLEQINMNLAGLHRTKFIESKSPDILKVFFLSNAIENIYTSPAWFKLFMSGVKDNLKNEQSLIAVHHVAGFPHFGLYRLTKKEGTLITTTVCKDVYTNTKRIKGVKLPRYYKTYFEGVSKTKKPPRCGWLLRKIDKAIKKKKQKPALVTGTEINGGDGL